jgi:hypothetical protein
LAGRSERGKGYGKENKNIRNDSLKKAKFWLTPVWNKLDSILEYGES